MRMIIYDKITVTIMAGHNISTEDQTDLFKILRGVPDQLQSYTETRLIPEHLKKKVVVIVGPMELANMHANNNHKVPTT